MGNIVRIRPSAANERLGDATGAYERRMQASGCFTILLGPMSSPTSSPYDGITIAGTGGVWTRPHRHASVVGNDLDEDLLPQS